MRKKYIVAVDNATEEQNLEFKSYINDSSCGWWHWIDNLWLLTDPKGEFSAQEIRDKVKECFPKLYCLVIEMSAEGDTWSGYGPKGEDRNMFKWLRDSWDKDLE